MSINYADTVSMNYPFSVPFRTLYLPRPWKFCNSAKDARLHYWSLKQDKSFMAFYPDMYGRARLFVTYSVPRLLKGSNTFNVRDFDEDAFYKLIEKETAPFPWNLVQPVNYYVPLSFDDWQISRLDLFLMHEIPSGQRDEYMSAYELLMLPGYRPVRYKNTYYLNSSKRPDRKSNKVFRVYPKIKEIQERLTGEDYPLAVHRNHERFLHMDEKTRDYIRFEWMLRRSVIRYKLKKQNILYPAVRDVFSRKFQEEMLSELIAAVGLDRLILCRRDYKNAVKPLFKTDKTYQNALLYARQIRNGQNVTLTKYQSGFVKKTLKDNGIHFITTPYKSLVPVSLNP